MKTKRHVITRGDGYKTCYYTGWRLEDTWFNIVKTKINSEKILNKEQSTWKEQNIIVCDNKAIYMHVIKVCNNKANHMHVIKVCDNKAIHMHMIKVYGEELLQPDLFLT